MISAAWDWYYGSQDEELLADCEFGEPYSIKRYTNKNICVRPATLNNGLQVTIFTQVKTRPKDVTDLEKCSKRLKLLRHPNILRHIGFVCTETEAHLVTERVSPLYLQFETADANEVSSGIYDIAQALNFLHEKAGLSHNAVSIESIYVAEGGAWKLSNFEYACPFEEATADHLKTIKRPKEIMPPEESDSHVGFPIEKKYGHCRDVYALGILLGIFNKEARFASEVKTQELQDLLEEILQKEYTNRPKISELLDTAILTSEYIQIVNFLQSITLKNKADKKKFFSGLIARLKKACISDELIAKRIAKLILSPVVLSETDAVENILPRLLSPIPLRTQVSSNGLISSSMFARHVIPQIVDLMDIKILHVRLALVRNFHRYVHMFDKTVLQDAVLPEILLGLHDANNQLVKESLHALADAVPIVGGDLIVGAEREKIFGFGMPKFNGSVLIDASSLAYEIKPKRKPKPPKKKSPVRPLTLLEMAMRRQQSPSKRQTQKQRDLMMLKQHELAMTFVSTAPKTNGITPSLKEEEVVLEVSCEGNHIDLTQSLSNGVNGYAVTKAIVPESVITVAEAKQPLPETNKANTDHYDIRKKEIRQPEVETWAGSGSEEETWDNFDTFDNDDIEHPSIEAKSIKPAEDSQLLNDHNFASTNTKGETEKPESTMQQNTENLGNEFEIAVKVASIATNSEPDFFADMTPDIPTRKVPVLPTPPLSQNLMIRSGSVTTESLSTKSSPISVSFTANDDLADDEATDGWENDTIAWDD
uniref:protein-associating with the carboxyl-terminal domain of ezrin-like n=1 Tax=Styela clava TaxID=7725 RepID=UPI00193A687A|nr:protein-associating with the carboxyl-terminal domain of ezrin-like [Styela clava]